MIKVLAAIVVPPHLAVSGGARAGEELSAALADHCRITVANMMGDKVRVAHAAGHVQRIPVTTWLPPFMPWSRLPARYSTLFYRSTLPRIVREGDFDLVHIHNPMPALEMERVAHACLARGLPYVVTTHGFNEVANGGQVYGFDPVRRTVWKTLVEAPVARVARHADGIFALSPADFDVVRGMGFTGAELPVVTNGVAPPTAAAADDADRLERLGIPAQRLPGQIACMFLANHTPNKGLPVLLEAFAGLERPYLLIVAGEKRSEIDYASYIARCRPGQRIVVTGRLSDAEVAAAFRRSDLFVFPTLADTFPLVVLEAMAHGLPVLASRVGGIPHQVESRFGELVEPGDVGALRAAVDRLARDPAHLAAMGRAARHHAAHNYTWEKAATDALAAYERIMRSRSMVRRAPAVRAHAGETAAS